MGEYRDDRGGGLKAGDARVAEATAREQQHPEPGHPARTTARHGSGIQRRRHPMILGHAREARIT
jgi:hypothetical protein